MKTQCCPSNSLAPVLANQGCRSYSHEPIRCSFTHCVPSRSRLAKSQAINHEAKTIVSHLKGQLDALAAHVTGRQPPPPSYPQGRVWMFAGGLWSDTVIPFALTAWDKAYASRDSWWGECDVKLGKYPSTLACSKISISL